MPSAPTPKDEAARLLALQQTQLLDTLPEPEFDELVALAAELCDAPVALVSLVDENRQWFKARQGLEVPETGRDVAFCGYTILNTRPMIVPDASEDARFAANPLVTGKPGIRFYAGAPLLTPEGQALGSLCVIDRRPRQLSALQERSLVALARQVMQLIELRRYARRQRELKDIYTLALDSVEAGVWMIPDLSLDQIGWSDRAYQLLGYEPAREGSARDLGRELIHPDDQARLQHDTLRAHQLNQPFSSELRIRSGDGTYKRVLLIGQASNQDGRKGMVGIVRATACGCGTQPRS